jgi:hypothetical protein
MIHELDLRHAVPTDQLHLVISDDANSISLRLLCNEVNADYINYRDDLLQRVSTNDNFLVLDRYIDREIHRIRELCTNSVSGVVLLHEMDVLVAYLTSRPGKKINLFWDRLMRTRHLDAIAWIVMPSACKPLYWPNERIQTIRSVASIGNTNGTVETNCQNQ